MRRFTAWLPLVSASSALVGTVLVAVGCVGAPVRPAPDDSGVRRRAALAKADELDRQVVALSASGRFADAVPLAEEALTLREDAFGPDDPRLLASLEGLSRALRHTGALARARGLLERDVALREAQRGPEHPEVAEALGQLGVVLTATGEHEAARDVHERALAIARASLGADHPLVAQSLVHLAGLARASGRPDDARRHLEHALAIRVRAFGPDHPEVARCLSALAQVLRAGDELDEARFLAERALSIRERGLGPTHLEVAFALEELAAILGLLGEGDRALTALLRARGILSDRLGADHPDVAITTARAARVAARLGDERTARRLGEDALAIRQAHLGADHPSTARCLVDLARVDLAAGHAEVAVRRAETARLALERDGEEEALAEALVVLARARAAMGETEVAAAILERSLAIIDHVRGARDPLFAEVLLRLARLRSGDADAVDLADRAVASLGASLGADHPATLAGRLVHAETLRDHGAAPEARRLEESVFETALRQARGLRAGAAPADAARLAGVLRAALAARLARAGELASAGDADARAALYGDVLRVRATLADHGERQRRAVGRAGGDADSLFAELDRGRRRAARALGSLIVSDEPAVEARRGDLDRCDGLAVELERRVAGFVAEPGRVGPADLRAALIDGEALYDIVRAGGRYHGWLVRPAGPVTHVDLGAAAEVDAAAARFVDAVLAAVGPDDSRARATGARLARLVLGPIEGEGVGALHVVPGGVLATIPWAALPASDGEGALIDGPLRVSLLSTAEDLVAPAWPWIRGEGALLMGGIDADAAVEAVAVGGPRLLGRGPSPTTVRPAWGRRFEPWPSGSAALARAAAALEAGAPDEVVVALEGAQATEAVLRRLAPGRRFVHLGARAFVRIDRAVVSGDELDAEGLVATRLELSDLVGVALAGANHDGPVPGGDGVLTGREASSLDLEGAEVIVVAFEPPGSGRGVEGADPARRAADLARRGEGLLAFVRALREAGARTVAVRLWPDGDETHGAVAALYEGVLAPGETSPGEAVRRAAARGRRAGEPPRRWSAMATFGPPR